MIYHSNDGKKVQIFMALEESLVLRAVSSMLDMPLTKIDKLVMNAGKELSLRIAEQLGMHAHLSSKYHLESSHFISAEQFEKIFYLESIDYSLLFNTGCGYFAFCIKLL